uniref:Uncharacterized protein n=1 Tax=Anguilla anguilla TaxID=7936 RepID=A0A0E9QRE5_ANGAN
MVNGLHFYSALSIHLNIQSTLQLMPLIHPFSHYTHFTNSERLPWKASNQTCLGAIRG